MSTSRKIGVTAALLCAALISVGAARATAGLAGFGPAAAVSTDVALATVATSQTDDLDANGRLDSRLNALSSPEPTAAVLEPTPEPTSEPAPPEPVRTPAPAVARQPVSAPIAAVATPAPSTCPATWFCYPRLGIAGPIVPYTDCSGSTDVGTAIRSYSCLSDHYLMGHAYTQFGLVTRWIAGDVVFAWGQRYTVSGAVTQQSCAAPTVALAPLSMQTSLTSNSCGAVLVVQAR
jgi:hypothetical protein